MSAKPANIIVRSQDEILVELKNLINSVDENKTTILNYWKEVKLKGGKSNPLQGKVFELTVAKVTIHDKYSAYHDMINEAYIAQGQTPAEHTGERRWGKHIDDSPIIEHNGQYYLQLVINEIAHRSYYIEHEDTMPTPEEIEHIEATRYRNAANELPIALVAIKGSNILFYNEWADQLFSDE